MSLTGAGSSPRQGGGSFTQRNVQITDSMTTYPVRQRQPPPSPPQAAIIAKLFFQIGNNKIALVTPYRIRIGKFGDNILFSGHLELHSGEVSSVLYRILKHMGDIQTETPFRKPVHECDIRSKWAMMVTGDHLETSRGSTYYIGIRLFRNQVATGGERKTDGSEEPEGIFTPTGRGVALSLEELCLTLEVLGNCLTSAYSTTQENRIIMLQMAELASETLEEGADADLTLYSVEKKELKKLKEIAPQALGKSEEIVDDMTSTWEDLILALSAVLVLKKRARLIFERKCSVPEKRMKRVLRGGGGDNEEGREGKEQL